MYLLKLPSGVYYTRVPTPVQLKEFGYPAEIRLSLLTKHRNTAMITR